MREKVTRRVKFPDKFQKGIVKTTSGDGVAAKSMGIQAQLYTTSMKLTAASTYSYNEKGESKVSASTGTVKTSETTYYAKSNVKLYNGSGYTIYQSERTAAHKAPSKSAARINTSTTFETVAFQGERMTYGSGTQLDTNGAQPDLINAIGTNGEEGYVLASDLESAAENATYIPVYTLDGNIIDSFVVGG